MSEVVIPSRTTPGIEYRVLVGPDGTASCTCPGWDFHGHCWHLNAARKELGMTNEQSTALVPIKVTPPATMLPSVDEVKIILAIATHAAKASGIVPAAIKTAEQAFAVMLTGHEMGVRPMTALRHIFIVNGRTEPSAQLMVGIIQANEPDAKFEVVNQTDESCTMRMIRPSRGINVEFTYTLDDAKKAGLIKQGGGWDKFPKDMMRWACVKRLARVYASDLINAIASVDVRDAAALMPEDAGIVIDSTVLNRIPESQLRNDGDDGRMVDVTTGEIIEPGGDPQSQDEPEQPASEPQQLADAPPAEPEGAPQEPQQPEQPELAPPPAQEPEAAPEPPAAPAGKKQAAAKAERPLRTPGDLLTWALRTHGLSRDDVLKMLKLKDSMELTDFGIDNARAWIEEKQAEAKAAPVS